MPTISVLMPVYNAAAYVADAIHSLLSQTYSDFELIVFNDGSSDESSEIIKSIRDERIIFIDSSENKGYVSHLNTGLSIAKGKYIARMDADDISLPTRFAKQVALLESTPEVGLCGTFYQTFGASSVIPQMQVDNVDINRVMLFQCPMAHPTTMFRKSLVDEYDLRYDTGYMPAEDYKLWYDFSKVTLIQNIPEVLLHYRVHPHQVSSHMSGVQQINASKVRLIQLLNKGFELSESEQDLYMRMFCFDGRPQTPQELTTVINLAKKVKSENSRLNAYKEEWIDNTLALTWSNIINSIYKFSPSHLASIFLLNKPFVSHFGALNNLKIFLKCLLSWQVKIAK